MGYIMVMRTMDWYLCLNAKYNLKCYFGVMWRVVPPAWVPNTRGYCDSFISVSRFHVHIACALLCVCWCLSRFYLRELVSRSLSVSLSLLSISGLVSCACCADNQWIAAAGSVQQEQGPGLLSVAFCSKHTDNTERGLLSKLQVWSCKIPLHKCTLHNKNISYPHFAWV